MRIDTKNKLLERYRNHTLSYTGVFQEKSPMTQQVLEDLAEFCRAQTSTFHPDARVHALLEGRREVWLRIKDFLTLNAEQLLEKYTRAVSVDQQTPENER